MVDDDLQSIIYDIGSHNMKIGFSGDDAPRAVFPTIMGRPKNPGILIGMDAKDCFIGDEAHSKRGILKLSTPVRNDRTEVDYSGLKKILHHCPYNELCISPEEHPFLMTSLHHMSDHDFKKMTSIQFEWFNVPAFYMCDSNVLSTYSTGIDTEYACSLECGHGIIRVCCVYGGLPIQNTKIILEDQNAPPRKRIGGELMNDLFCKLLSEKGNNFVPTTLADKEIAIDIKEEFATLRLKDNNDGNIHNLREWEDKEYELPDGSKLSIGEERFDICEILFRPSIVGYRLPGIAELVKMSIEKCPSELRDRMYENIIISGGLIKIKNFEERLSQELKEITSKKFFINRYKESYDSRGYDPGGYWGRLHRKNEFSAWVGGSVLTSLSSFNKFWITKDEYDDHGVRITEIKCLECTRHNDQRGLFSRFQSVLDVDLEERRDYAIHDAFCSEGKYSITLVLPSCSDILIKFKSLLLL